MQVEEIGGNTTNASVLTNITTQLAVATTPRSISLLPTDLNTTNYVLSEVISTLESDDLEVDVDLMPLQEVGVY